MARHPRYEDTVSYDATPEADAEDDRFDPNSGRPWSEIATARREAARLATVEKAALFLTGIAA